MPINILGRIAEEFAAFRPRTVEEFFAFWLCHKLSDRPALRRYLKLLELKPLSDVLSAYRAALQTEITNRIKMFWDRVGKEGQPGVNGFSHQEMEQRTRLESGGMAACRAAADGSCPVFPIMGRNGA